LSEIYLIDYPFAQTDVFFNLKDDFELRC